MAAWSKLAPPPGLLTGNRNLGIFAGALAVAIGYLWHKKLKDVTGIRDLKDEVRISSDKVLEKKQSEKAAVDARFLRGLLKILKLIIPGWFSKESGYLVLVAISLVFRTVLDVWMINNTTTIESAIIQRDLTDFKTHLLKFVYLMPFISIVNNVLKYGLNELKLRFRSRLSTQLLKEYLSDFTYYKMCNLDNRISNADQLLTQDVEKFCDTFTDLYSNLSKPLLDICIYVYKLTGAIGFQGPGIMIGYLAFSGLILTKLRRPVGMMTVEEQHLEGEYRFVNSRLITNSEEVAFYQGDRREYWTIKRTFQRLVDHLRNFLQFRFAMGVIDNIIAKYVATMIGFLIVGVPFMNPDNPVYKGLSFDARMQEYYRSGRMLVRMAQAIGRIVLSGRDLTRLAGFTQRVITLMNVLKDLKKGVYKRTMLNQNKKSENGESSDDKAVAPLVPGSGETIEMDHFIRFEHVPLVTPNGDVLVNDLTFEVKSGVNVLICGPNGCGKSSLFRILGELWPLFGGKLTKPHRNKLFYIPQRPYMTLGTLRDQIIYPDKLEDQQAKGITDEQLLHSLKQVHLDYILEREGGWDSIQDWMDVLSGGEKQRVAMARLFYHKPQFAILDECTSAVSVDVEDFIYSYCREIGITLFTVSHRKSLWKHHEFVLQFDGRGDVEYKAINEDTVEFGS